MFPVVHLAMQMKGVKICKPKWQTELYCLNRLELQQIRLKKNQEDSEECLRQRNLVLLTGAEPQPWCLFVFPVYYPQTVFLTARHDIFIAFLNKTGLLTPWTNPYWWKGGQISTLSSPSFFYFGFSLSPGEAARPLTSLTTSNGCFWKIPRFDLSVC